jgi:hypothetical protein
MDTVEEKGRSLHPGRFRREVKNEAVEEILGKRPEKQAERKTKNDMKGKTSSRFKGRGRQMIPDGAVQEVDRNGYPDDGNDCGMDVGEKLEEIRFEQPDGFFIVDDFMTCRIRHGRTLLFEKLKRVL